MKTRSHPVATSRRRPDESVEPEGPVSGTTAQPTDGPTDPSGGPGTLDWWLDDGPDSPVAADIEEPEKHL